MEYSGHAARDPRTLARDIPGILEIMFPQLTPGVVVHLNQGIRSVANVIPVPPELIDASKLSKAMLFEVGVERGQQILEKKVNADWKDCLRVAVQKQSRYFDARLPESLDEIDLDVAERVGKNLARMMDNLCRRNPGAELLPNPRIAGYQWISSSDGDFSIATKIIEVKCTAKRFGAADYRQVLMYWLLSYADSVERDSREWSHCILVNPRVNHMVEVSFDEIIDITAAGRTKIEILELFAVVVGEYGLRASMDLEM